MKPLYVTLIFIALCGASFSIWLYFCNTSLPDASQTDVTPPPLSQELNYQDTLKKSEQDNEQDTALYNDAIATKNIALCDGIKNTNQKNTCTSMLGAIQALDKKDKNLCSTLADPKVIGECNNRISLALAEEQQDKSLCDAITESGSQTYCYNSIDASRLETILSEKSATEPLCQTLEWEYQEKCIASIVRAQNQDLYVQAVQQGNGDNCELITNETEKTLCLDIVHLKHALVVKDLAECDQITQWDKKSYCQKVIGKQDEIIQFKEYVSSNNMNGCNSLTDLALKNKCHDTVTLALARSQKDETLCDSLTQTGMIATCKKIAQ